MPFEPSFRADPHTSPQDTAYDYVPLESVRPVYIAGFQQFVRLVAEAGEVLAVIFPYPVAERDYPVKAGRRYAGHHHAFEGYVFDGGVHSAFKVQA